MGMARGERMTEWGNARGRFHGGDKGAPATKSEEAPGHCSSEVSGGFQ